MVYGDSEHSDIGRETIADEHIQFHAILMTAINRVSLGIINDYDAGIGAMLSLFGLLPKRVREQFGEDIKYFRDVARSKHYIEEGKYRVTRSVRSEYAIQVSDCLARITDALDDAGLLWKTKSELVGGEL